MIPMAINVTRKKQFLDKFYFPAILKGMWITFKHLIRPDKHSTIEYPEEKWKPYSHYRGTHRLNKDENGRIKCVACEMCATACPAHCIHITPGPAPVEWKDRERVPVQFDIDMLRCIYCGMCEEACPEEAIELTEIYEFSEYYTREGFIWNKEKLLKMYDLTKNGYYPGDPGSFSKIKKETVKVK